MMKRILSVLFCLGLASFLMVGIIFKSKIPENLEVPIFFLIGGFIYIPFLIGFLIEENEGKHEMFKIDGFHDFRFVLGLISYPAFLIIWLIFVVIDKVK